MILSNWCVVTQFYYRIIAVDTFLLFQLHFTTRVKIKEKLNEKNVLFSGTVEIDSETYLPKNIIRDEEE